MDVLERRLLAMAAAHSVVSVEQLAYRTSGQWGHAALPLSERLIGDGLLRRVRWARADGELVCISAAGLAAIGSRLRPSGLVLGDVRGELGRVLLWLAGWDGAFGEMLRVLSRRELEGVDRAAMETAGAPSGFGTQVAGGVVYPDVAMETDGGNRIAVYVSLWPNRAFDAEAIFVAHRDAGNVDRLLLVTDGDEAFRGRCRAAAERLGISDWVHIRSAKTAVKNLPAGYS